MAADTEVQVKVTAATEGLSEGMRQASEVLRQAVGSLNSQFASLGAAFSSVTTAAAVATAALVGIGAAASAIRDVIRTGDELNDLSHRFGVAVETVNAFRFASSQAGVDITELGMSFRKMQAAIVEAQKPGSDMAHWFQAIGAQAKDFAGKDIITQFMLLTRALSAYADDERRAAAEAQIFGRGAQAVNQIVNDGVASFQASMHQASAWSTANARASDAVADAWKLAKERWADLFRTIAMDLHIPQLVEGAFVTMQSAAVLATSAWRGLADAVRAAADMLDRVRHGAPPAAALQPLSAHGTATTPGNITDQLRGLAPPVKPPVSEDERAQRMQELFQREMELSREAMLQAGHDAEQKLAITRETTLKIAQLFGEESAEYRKAKLQELAAEREFADQQLRIADIGIEAHRATQNAILDQEKATLEQQRSFGEIGLGDYIAHLQALEDARHTANLQALQDQQAGVVNDPERQAQLNAQIEAETFRHMGTVEEITRTRGRSIQEVFQGIGNAISGSFSTAISGVIMGTTRLRDAMRNVGQSIVLSFAQAGLKLVTDWAADQAKLLFIHVAGEEARTAATEEGALERVAIGAWETVKSVYQAAADAAAKVWAWMTDTFGLPGAIAGAAVAAALFSGVAAYAAYSSEGGLGEVPSGGAVAVLHPQETVLPADLATPLRSALRGEGRGRSTDKQVVNVDTVQRPITVQGASGKSVDTRLQASDATVSVQPSAGTLPVSVGEQLKAEITNPAGRPVFVHQVNQAGGMISEVSSMGQGYGLGGGGGSFAGGGEVDRDQTARLHRKEMVLPAHLADVIRDLAADRQAGMGAWQAGDPAVHLHVHAVDARSVERLFRENGHLLGRVLREQLRQQNRT